jgi:hypothetical protein
LQKSFNQRGVLTSGQWNSLEIKGFINMITLIFTPSSKVEKLKQKVRKLKKKQELSHHEALDQTAQQGGYHHWHHVTEMATITEPSETAYRSGLLVAFDVKEAESFDAELFTEDRLAPFFCTEQLWKTYLDIEIEEDPEFHELPESEQREYFQDFMENLIFYRYCEKNTPSSIEEAVKLINEYSFWMPEYIWLKGKLYDTYPVPATDSDGNITGVRF